MAKWKERKFATLVLENLEANLVAKHPQFLTLVANINVLELNVQQELAASNQAVAWELLVYAHLDKRKR